MIISVNWLKKFVPDLPEIDELSKLIGARLVEIESIENLNEKYKDVIIARVISAKKVEGSDHLNLCKIDDGGKRDGVERDENGFIQVVCGAPNVREGLFVAWLPPKAIVPETFGGENFQLSARKLMGNMSNGMIASLRELGLGDEHDGILEILPETFENGLQAGDSFAEKFELNDYLLEVENKSLTHRPDCFGIIGFAREVAGILGQKFVEPDFIKQSDFGFEVNNDKSIVIDARDSEICERYTAAVFDVSDISKNPNLTLEKTYLLRSGMRPIDVITDLANELMLETGQPLHTFDFDKLVKINGSENVKMTVRKAFENEELELLYGRKIKMSQNDIVIATGENGENAVALAGAMGGKSTEIDENTTRILVESATFNLYNLRNTQMRHGIFSEAITRFTKGVPEMMSRKVLDLFGVQLLALGGKSLSEIADSKGDFYYNKSEISVSKDKINQILGTNFSSEEIQKTLENVGILTKNDNSETFVVPFWRNDLHIEEDLIEEVGRLNGYDNIKLQLPKRTFRAVKKAKIDLLQSEIREILVSSGANEILTYTFVHGDLLKKAGQDPKNAYKIINSISPELQYYRQTLTPSLLSKVNQNIRAGFSEFAIFEMNKITEKTLGLNEENVPFEQKKLAFVYTKNKGENAFFEAKNYAEFLFKKLGLKVKFIKFDLSKSPLSTEFEPKRSALIQVSNPKGEKILGVIGEFKKKIQKALKLPESTAGFELDLGILLENTGRTSVKIKDFSKFQSVERDISINVDESRQFAEIFDIFKDISSEFKGVEIETLPIDIFNNGDGTKNISIRFKITPFEKTLNGDEIRDIMQKIEEKAVKNGGKII
ncbi:MAG: phenylalanine--tRNA ligase subunit beta [Candidatus Nanogingivalaceae bacterium]|nr:phenylalanine--tRNA ligase subunit beta [Candidatus Nanogingivalaceae bacterium]